MVALGVVQVLASDLSLVGIGGWPSGTALAMAGFHVAGGALAGAAIAWVVRPQERHGVA